MEVSGALARLGDVRLGDADLSSSLARVNATATALSNNTLSAFSNNALVNLNFDFTLIKVAPPEAFQVVGNTISEKRKKNAESGTLHRTARKLGALFEGILPSTPELVRAYGARVSEICASEKVNPHGSSRFGIFSRQVGADTASIWAAVTSGDAAIAVHLLACMLSRIWTGPEATSLWIELIAARKKQIEDEIQNATQPSKFDAAAWAAQQDISRDEIANWDDSARSWRQSADLVMAEQHNRVIFMTANAGLPANEEPETYKSVIKAWTDSLTAMNHLVAGRPQKVQSGAILLGLTAWHLYPNLLILSRPNPEVIQKDPLVLPGGVLTVGLESVDKSVGGVSWSLPLAYMKYYGDPVLKSRVVAQDTSRISMDQFGFILLGSIFAGWDEFGRKSATGLKWALILSQALRQPAKSATRNASDVERMDKLMSRSSWIGQLLSAADDYADSGEVNRGTALKLIGLGRRQKNFLCSPVDHPPPLFGLCEFAVLFSTIEGSEVRIKYLRRMAEELELLNDHCIIRYVVTDGSFEFTEFASLAPNVRTSDSGYLRRKNEPSTKKVRWISISTTSDPPCKCKGSCLRPEIIPTGSKKSNGCPCWSNGGCSIECHDWKKSTIAACHTLGHGTLLKRISAIEALGEQCLPVHEIKDARDPRNGCLDFGVGSSFELSLLDLYKERRPKNPTNFVELHFCAGDRRTAMIQKLGAMTARGVDKRTGCPGFGTQQLGEFITAPLLESLFDPKHLSYRPFSEWFASGFRNKGYTAYLTSLRACAAAAEIYKLLPDARITPVITSQTLKVAKWIPRARSNLGSPLRLSLERPEVFACIAMFEQGLCNLDPAGLTKVFALSSGNSIYVTSPLLCDPYEQPATHEIRRIPGNIGRAGLSLLVPPPVPRMLTPRVAENWMLLPFQEFQGQLEDNFGQTSIHLSFTEYNPPLQAEAVDEHTIDQPVRLLETIAQVYDRTRWIADLDILAALNSPRLLRVVCNETKHQVQQEAQNSVVYLDVFGDVYDIVSNDNWDEIITPSEGTICIVRARDNWLARLATATVGIQQGRTPSILPKDVCWICCKAHVDADEATRTLLIA